MMIVSETRIESLIKKGRKERSDALLWVFHGLWAMLQSQSGAKQIGATSKQSCPN